VCKHKSNQLYLTHFDWDHIRFAKRFQNLVPKFCWWPVKKNWIPENKRAFIEALKPCHSTLSTPAVRTISNHVHLAENKNDRGPVYILKHRILVPGDQSTKLEWSWVTEMSANVERLGVLILPHHGSKTGTGARLLNQVSIRLAIASARKKRYGHPHPNVIQRLKSKGIGHMTTETFGSIFIPDKW